MTNCGQLGMMRSNLVQAGAQSVSQPPTPTAGPLSVSLASVALDHSEITMSDPNPRGASRAISRCTTVADGGSNHGMVVWRHPFLRSD
jgi:hypothetical protein